MLISIISVDKDQFIEQVEKMSVADLNELVKALEEKFGVSAAAFAASAGATPAGAEAKGGEEKDAYSIILKDAGTAKIQVIKVLRELTSLGLKEAKDMTDKVPVTVKEGVKKEEADEIKKKIEEAGGTVELK